jgi:hypothetical protein
MPNTTRLGLPYPQLISPADVPADIQALAEALDGAALIDAGPLSGRPVSTSGSPGRIGRFYLSTDTNPMVLYIDTGTSWVAVNSIAAGSIVASMIANGAVGASALAISAVGTAAIANGAVTNPKLGAGAVDEFKMAHPVGAFAKGVATISPGQTVGTQHQYVCGFPPKMMEFTLVPSASSPTYIAYGKGISRIGPILWSDANAFGQWCNFMRSDAVNGAFMRRHATSPITWYEFVGGVPTLKFAGTVIDIDDTSFTWRVDTAASSGESFLLDWVAYS